jgi:DNA polymerase III alpha subunit
MKESRYNTLKKKYEPYKKIYHKNSKSQSFANWYFERELLGFSYSSRLANIFSHEDKKAHDSLYFKSLDSRRSSKYIFVVTFSKKEKSRNGNLYIKLEVEDEHGSLEAILVDNSRERKCSNYLANNPVPKEGNIVTLNGSKTPDGESIFINNLKIIDEMIYMNLRDLKGERV